MTPAEIIVRHPKLNTNHYRQYVYNENHKNYVAWLLQNEHITHKTHPHVLDLCAGNLSGSWIFSQLSWSRFNITAIDIDRPNPKILHGVRVLYVDVNAFGEALMHKERIIPKILKPLEHHFNIVLESYATAKPRLINKVVQYFLAPNGEHIVL